MILPITNLNANNLYEIAYDKKDNNKKFVATADTGDSARIIKKRGNHGKTIFQIWCNGLRQNHAATPSGIQLRRAGNESLRHQTSDRYQKRRQAFDSHWARARN